MIVGHEDAVGGRDGSSERARDQRHRAVSRSSAALAGVVAGGLAIGLSEWTSGIAKGVPSLVASVGQTM